MDEQQRRDAQAKARHDHFVSRYKKLVDSGVNSAAAGDVMVAQELEETRISIEKLKTAIEMKK